MGWEVVGPWGGGGGGGVDWGRGEGGCHVSMWKLFLDQCKKGWMGVASGAKKLFTVGSVNFFLTPLPPPPPPPSIQAEILFYVNSDEVNGK